MRRSQEMCLDRFGRKNVFPVDRPNETMIYQRKKDGYLALKYKSQGIAFIIEEND